MAVPNKPIQLTPEEIETIAARLGEMRHAVNNCLALVVASAELVRLKPDASARVLENLLEQPDKVVEET